MNPFDKFTTDQLKVMVYDLSVSMQNIQNDLKALNDEISRRQSERAFQGAEEKEKEKEGT